MVVAGRASPLYSPSNLSGRNSASSACANAIGSRGCMGRRNEPRLLEPTTGSRPAWLRRLWSDPESRRFLVMLSLTGSYCLTEMVTGVYLDSLALQSDAMHMLSDALALIVGLAATIVGRRQTGAATARVDAVGGLVNGVFLLSGLG